MIAEDHLDIRLFHHPEEHPDAAVAVPVDYIPQDVKGIGVGKTG